MAALTLFGKYPVCLAVAAISMPPFATTFAHAQTIGADQRAAFDIPAQPLDAALAQYFRVTGVQLLYDSALATGRRSSTVRGNYTPREAMRLLLRGTGLVARYSRTNAAIITAPEARDATPLIPLGRVVVREQITISRPTTIQRIEFYGRLAHELHAYLRDDRRTHRLTFDMRASIRIGTGGALERIRIDRSSGDPLADRLVAEVLAGRKVSTPPEGIAQPLLVALKGRRRAGD
ncbi:hypothetical protein E5A73_20690 [Sphingomonas gei]|uniref:Secretin/TonB short N-terminal domain-containing protein n=1 Tax=Sphingomonas gei TaxID=1395960 RepID=A0A4S1X3C7_9SPHN|nr:STN domain-containing protein [Sphingomonas gei]TGX48726.1 hypothetical protein E5A73_20690 [Sphingomonas gei]